MKDYIINECGVCQNPDVVLEYNVKGKPIDKVKCKVELMECPDGYLSGHAYDTFFGSCMGTFSPVSIHVPKKSKDECIKYELESIKDTVEQALKEEQQGSYDYETGKIRVSKVNVKLLQDTLQWINQHLGPRQLTLFDI